jgi:hypothetical protein
MRGEVARHQGDDRGHDQRGPDPLEDRPAKQQHAEVRRQGRRERPRAVDEQPDQERALSANHRPDLAARHHQHRHHERVENDCTLDAGDRRVEVVGDGRDGDVHDRAVERHQELSGAQRQ